MDKLTVEDCTICFEPLISDIVALKCGHVLHEECCLRLQHSNSKKCPSCRNDIHPRDGVIKLYYSVKKVETSIEDALPGCDDIVTLKEMITELHNRNKSFVAQSDKAKSQINEAHLTIKDLNERVNELEARMKMSIQQKTSLIQEKEGLNMELLRTRKNLRNAMDELRNAKAQQSVQKYWNNPIKENLFEFIMADGSENNDPQALTRVIEQQHRSLIFHKHEYSKLVKVKKQVENELTEFKSLLQESRRKEKKTKKQLIESLKGHKENVLTKPLKNEFDLDDVYTGPRKKARQNSDIFFSSGKSLRISKMDNSEYESLKSERGAVQKKTERPSFNPFQDPKAWSRKTSFLQSRGKSSFMNNKNRGEYLRTGYDDLGRRKEFRVAGD